MGVELCSWSRCEVRIAVTYVEVGNVVGVGSLDTDGERFKGMKNERHQSAEMKNGIK